MDSKRIKRKKKKKKKKRTKNRLKPTLRKKERKAAKVNVYGRKKTKYNSLKHFFQIIY